VAGFPGLGSFAFGSIVLEGMAARANRFNPPPESLTGINDFDVLGGFPVKRLDNDSVSEGFNLGFFRDNSERFVRDTTTGDLFHVYPQILFLFRLNF
jgi:hypothetical protein